MSTSKDEAPATIWLSRGNARGSWEFSGCWGTHPFAGFPENVQYRRVELPDEGQANTDKEALETIASPWICIEEKPCEETVAVHWDELIAALAVAFTTIRQEERRAALDQACRVICPRCSLPESYTPAERVGNGKRWFHRAVNTSFEQGIASQCDAWTIRNLTLEAAAKTREDGDDG